jgi:Protein of unknown function (DUF1570)
MLVSVSVDRHLTPASAAATTEKHRSGRLVRGSEGIPRGASGFDRFAIAHGPIGRDNGDYAPFEPGVPLMRRCGLFLAAVVVFAFFSQGPAEADYIVAKFDMSLLYKNAPNYPELAPPPPPPQPKQPPPNMKGGGKGMPAPRPMPPPMPVVPAKIVPPVPPGGGPYIFTVIEEKHYYGTEEDPKKEGKAIVFDSPFGKQNRFLEMAGWYPNVSKYTLIKHETPAKKFAKDHKPDPAVKDEKKYLDAAEWALKHGLKDEFHATMDELAKFAPKRPEVVKYLKVQDALRDPPRAEDPFFAALCAELVGQKGFRQEGKGHYVVLTDLPTGAFGAGINDRLRVLETTMENYYYWFTLKPNLKQPELPQHRLGIMMLKNPQDFYDKHAEWGSQPFGGDAFTPRRDNYIISSFEHLDEVLKKYERNNEAVRQPMVNAGMNVSKADFLTSVVWSNQNAQFDPFRRAFCQTLTITEKLIADDQVRAAHTGEGSRQLLFDSGILPRHVHTPEWIAQGMSAYFETATGAPYLEVGAPNWRQVVNLKLFKQQGKLDKPGDVLRAVITDQYFRTTQRTFSFLAAVNDKAKVNLRIRDEYDLARSTAWALVYYQIERRQKPEKLIEYCRELDSLPRHLDLDERALEACFAKAFDLGESRNPHRLDPVKLNAFADDLFKEMSGVSLEIPELQNEYFDNRRTGKVTNSMN